MKNKYRVLIAFMLLMIALGANDALRGVFSTIFGEHFSLNASKLSWIVTVSYIGNLFFLSVGGRVLDKVNKKKAMLGFLILWMSALLLFIITDNYIVLLIGMFFAMGISTLLNTTINLVTPLLFASSPGFLVGLLFFVQGIGTSSSQSIAGNIAKGFDAWKIANAILLCFGFIAFVLLLFCQLPDTRKEKETVEAKSKTFSGKICSNRAFVPLIFIFGFYFIAEHGILNWFVNYASNQLRMGTGEAANYTAIFFGGIMIGRLLFSPLVDRIGIFKSLMLFASVASVLYIVGMLGGTSTAWVLGISGFFISIIYPVLVMSIAKLWPKEVTSSASGFVISIASLADILFNVVFGQMIERFGYQISILTLPFFMGCFVVILLIFCYLQIKKYNKA